MMIFIQALFLYSLVFEILLSLKNRVFLYLINMHSINLKCPFAFSIQQDFMYPQGSIQKSSFL